MSATTDPVILGPIMVVFVVLWFLSMFIHFRDPKPTPVQDSVEAATPLRRQERGAVPSRVSAEDESRAA